MNSRESQNRDSRNSEFLRLLAQNDLRLAEYIHTLVPAWHDAEDILQETKLRLWEQFDTFKLGSDFAAWAFTIARYQILTHRKQCKRRRLCFSEEVLEKLSQDIPHASTMLEERAVALVECIKMLSDSGRKILELFCGRHGKVKEIAKNVGRSPAATYQLLSRTRRQLFECVEKRLQEAGK